MPSAPEPVKKLAYAICRQLVQKGYCVQFVGMEKGDESMISISQPVTATIAQQVGLVGVAASSVRLWAPNGYITGKSEATYATEADFMTVFEDYKNAMQHDHYGSGYYRCKIDTMETIFNDCV